MIRQRHSADAAAVMQTIRRDACLGVPIAPARAVQRWQSSRQRHVQPHRGCRGSPVCQAGLSAAVQSLGATTALPVAALAQLPFSLPFSLPGLDVFSVLGFLLNNPVITVALAVGVYVFLPRLWRWVVRRIVAPALVLAVVFFAAQHPTQTVLLGKSILACASLLAEHLPLLTRSLPDECICAVVGSNPVLVSGVTIVALAVLLSPYILVAGAVFGLIYGLPQLPPPFNALVPAPVVEVCGGMCW